MKCLNGYRSVWSVRPIKCQARNHPDRWDTWNYDPTKPTTYNWNPKGIKHIEYLCKEFDACEKIREKYNVSDNLLSWEKTELSHGRIARFDFR